MHLYFTNKMENKVNSGTNSKPKVELINYTKDAINLLVFTKSGRLVPGTTYEDVVNMGPDVKHDHLEYMFDTIKGSFEFIDYVFHIKNVSRALTHQLVRTRTASFQQQSQRTVEIDESYFSYSKTTDHTAYDMAAAVSFECYSDMLNDGVDAQDARGILPTAVHTEITMKANLRTLSQMAELRLCKRTQGEYQEVFKMIVEEILKVHPWADQLLKVYCIKTGTCAFPRYDKCPVQKHCIDPNTVRPKIEEIWSKTKHVAAPKVDKNGMTM